MPEVFLQDILGDVSRETLTELETYDTLLRKWTQRINLVAPSSLDDAWTRHFLDSAQLLNYLPETARTVLDLGSGAGFPGLVLAILAKTERPDLQVTCIESDQRKATFLRTVLRETTTQAEVLSVRIEEAEPRRADVITARALAPVTDLLTYAERHRKRKGVCLFLKGRAAPQEIKSATQSWVFDVATHQSVSSPEGAVIEIREFHRCPK